MVIVNSPSIVRMFLNRAVDGHNIRCGGNGNGPICSMLRHWIIVSLFEHDPRANAFAFVVRESPIPTALDTA
jgi:hypothetical protein